MWIRIMIAAVALLALQVLADTAHAYGLSAGTVWHATFTSTSYTGTWYLRQEGSQVTGHITTGDNTLGEVSGSITDNILQLSRDTGANTIQYYELQLTSDTTTIVGKYWNVGAYADSGDMTLTATNAVPVTIAVTGNGSGSVSSDSGNFNWGSNLGIANFQPDSVVTLTPVPSDGSEFSGWTGACTGKGTCTLTTSQAQDVTATFSQSDKLLNVVISGTGSGTVTIAPGSIACIDKGCSQLFPYNASVSLMPTADSLSTFGGWSGCSTVDGAVCSVTMGSAAEVTATFNAADKARIGSIGYPSLSAAYAAAATVEPQTIWALDAELAEDLTLADAKTVYLSGGWNADYGSQSGLFTVLKGTLRIQNGELLVSGLKVR